MTIYRSRLMIYLKKIHEDKKFGVIQNVQIQQDEYTRSTTEMAFFNGFFPPVLEPEVPISREKKSLLRFAKGSDEFVTKKSQEWCLPGKWKSWPLMTRN